MREADVCLVITKQFPSQTAYHTLCSIAMELVGALESSVAGEQVCLVSPCVCVWHAWPV